MFNLYVMVFEPTLLVATHTYSPASDDETAANVYEFVAELKIELSPTTVGWGTPVTAQDRLWAEPCTAKISTVVFEFVGE